jgi:hypothetical protein
MRLFLIVALLLSWQSAPVSNDGIGEQNASRETSQGQQKVPSRAPVVSIGERMGGFQEGAPTHQQENANLYDPRNDRLYRWYLRATVVGVVGGFIGICLIFWQSILLRRSANAALLNARALMNTERARLAVDIELAKHGGMIQGDQDFTVNFTVRCSNIGRTPAWIHEIMADVRMFYDLPYKQPEFTADRAEHMHPRYLAAGDEPLVDTYSLGCANEYDPAQYVLIYGVVGFSDVYQKDGYCTFSYTIRPDRKGVDRVPDGAGYNRNTYEEPLPDDYYWSPGQRIKRFAKRMLNIVKQSPPK